MARKRPKSGKAGPEKSGPAGPGGPARPKGKKGPKGRRRRPPVRRQGTPPWKPIIFCLLLIALGAGIFFGYQPLRLEYHWWRYRAYAREQFENYQQAPDKGSIDNCYLYPHYLKLLQLEGAVYVFNRGMKDENPFIRYTSMESISRLWPPDYDLNEPNHGIPALLNAWDAALRSSPRDEDGIFHAAESLALVAKKVGHDEHIGEDLARWNQWFQNYRRQLLAIHPRGEAPQPET